MLLPRPRPAASAASSSTLTHRRRLVQRDRNAQKPDNSDAVAPLLSGKPGCRNPRGSAERDGLSVCQHFQNRPAEDLQSDGQGLLP